MAHKKAGVHPVTVVTQLDAVLALRNLAAKLSSQVTSSCANVARRCGQA